MKYYTLFSVLRWEFASAYIKMTTCVRSDKCVRHAYLCFISLCEGLHLSLQLFQLRLVFFLGFIEG